jgi:hypothetical protein
MRSPGSADTLSIFLPTCTTAPAISPINAMAPLFPQMAKNYQVMEKKKRPRITTKKKFPGYPHYPEGEDIFNQKQVEPDLDPEQPSAVKTLPADPETPNALDFDHDVTGSDLDVPGSELDDQQEMIGSEDEENNYYSLGGDEKEGLEEDKGDRSAG